MTVLSFDDANGNGITRDAALDSGDTFDSRAKNTNYGGTGGSNNTLLFYQGSGSAARKVGSTGGHGFTVGNYTSRDTTTATYRTVIPKMWITNFAALNPAGIDFGVGSGTGAGIGDDQHWWTVADDGTIPAPGWEILARGGFIIKPIDVTLRAFLRGTSNNPTETAIVNFMAWVDLSSTAGTDQNLVMDSPDYVETGFHVVGGTAGDPEITFQDVIDEDEGSGSTNFARAGLWTTLAQGIFQFYGALEVGRTYGNTATASEFNDSFKTLVCPGGYVREGFNYLEWDQNNSSVYLLDNITILGTGRSSIKRYFDSTIETSNGDVDEANDEINYTAHGFATGEQILYDREGNTGYVTGAAANGESQLVTGTTGEYYYAINVSANVFAVATSFANALAGTRQALTAQAGEIHSFQRTPDTRPDITITGTSGTWDFTNGNLTSCRIITLQSGAEIADSNIITCGELIKNAGVLTRCSISNPTVQRGEAFLTGVSGTELGNIDDCSFTGDSVELRGPGHAIEVDSAVASTSYGFQGNTFTNYASYSGTNFPWDGTDAGAGSSFTVDTTGNLVEITAHPYTDGEMVYYEDNGGSAIGGLTDGGLYYIGNIDANHVALYNTRTDATGDTNRISLTGAGTGTTHRFDSANAAIWNNSGVSWTLSVSAGGDTPSIRNTGAVEVTVENSVTLTVNVVDAGAVAIPYAKVRIENSSTGALISEGVANDSGTYVDSTYNYVGDLNVDVVVRKNSPGDTRYLPASSPALIDNGGLTTTVALAEDTNAGIQAPVGILRQGTVSENESGNAVITSSIDVPTTGTSRKLVVGAFYWDSATNLTVSAATYDGNAMTNIAGGSINEQEGAGNFHELQLYRYDIPDSDSGTKVVSITWSSNVAIKAISFAIIDDIATGAENNAANQSGDTVTTNPSVSLNNSAEPAWSVVFSMVDDTDSPTATGVATIRRSDLSVDGLNMLAVLTAERTTTGAHSLGVDYGSNNKTWVAGGATFLQN